MSASLATKSLTGSSVESKPPRQRLAPVHHAVPKAGVFVVQKTKRLKAAPRAEASLATKSLTGSALISSARQLLRLVRQKSASILVAFSGGKDSCAVLDLCSELGFKHIQPYYFFRVPGLDVAEAMLKRTEYRYSLRILRLPAPDLSVVLQHAFLQPHWAVTDKVKRAISNADVELYIREMTGIKWIASGKRMSDSLPRRGALRRCGGFDIEHKRVYP